MKLVLTPSSEDILLSIAMHVDAQANSQVQSLLMFLMSHLLENVVLEMQTKTGERQPVTVRVVQDSQATIQSIPSKPTKPSPSDGTSPTADADKRSYLYQKDFVDHLPPVLDEEEGEEEEEEQDDEEEEYLNDEGTELKWQSKPLTIEEKEQLRELQEEGELITNTREEIQQNYEFTMDYYQETLCSWLEYLPTAALRQYLIQQVQQVIEKMYGQRNIGVTINRTVRGIAMQFEIVDDLQMMIEVLESNEVQQSSSHFYARVYLEDIHSKSYLTWKQINTDLQTVFKNLETKLKYEIQQVKIPKEFFMSSKPAEMKSVKEVQAKSIPTKQLLEEEEDSALEQVLQEKIKQLDSKFLRENRVSDRLEDSLLYGNPNDYLTSFNEEEERDEEEYDERFVQGSSASNIFDTTATTTESIPFPDNFGSSFGAKTVSTGFSGSTSSSKSKVSSATMTTEKPSTVQEQAIDELNKILARSRGNGLYSIIEQVQKQEMSIADLALASEDASSSSSSLGGMSANDKEGSIPNLQELFRIGMNTSSTQSRDLYDSITPYQILQAINEFVHQNRMTIDDSMLQEISKGTLDFASSSASTDPKFINSDGRSIASSGESAKNVFQRISDFLAANTTAASLKSNAANAKMNNKRESTQWTLQNYQIDRLVEELERCVTLNLGGNIERNVLDSYRDLLLSDDFLSLMKERNAMESVPLRRQCYAKMIETSLLLNHELMLLLQKEQMKYLEVVEEICDIAKTYQSQELLFLQAMDRLKPQFTTDFYKFMNYMVAEEEEKVIKEYLLKQASFDEKKSTTAGLGFGTSTKTATTLPEGMIQAVDSKTREMILRQHLSKPTWLGVLLVVRQGIELELMQRFDYSLEALWLLIRFEQASIRTEILQAFINVTPATELPYLRELGMNMIDNIDQQLSQYELPNNFGYDVDQMPSDLRAMLDFDPNIPPRLLLFREELNQYLSDELIQQRLEEHAEEARAQGKDLVLKYRNLKAQEEITQQEVQAKEIALHGYSDSSINDMMFTDATELLHGAVEDDEDEKKTKRFIPRLPEGVVVKQVDQSM